MKLARGFNLLELMIVISVIAVLAMVAMPTYRALLARSKRSEAYALLHSLYVAEQAYFAEKGVYTDQLIGDDSLNWEAQGAHIYSYGFSGGGNSVSEGSLHAPASALGSTSASKEGFVAAAAADIDGDGVYDVLTIDQTGQIKITTDDIKTASNTAGTPTK